MASKAFDILTLAITLHFLAVPFSSFACTKEDVKALIAFKNSFPPKTLPKSWDNEANCCFWEGVRCNHGRVTSLYFTSDEYTNDVIPVNFNATLPPSVGDLSALQGIRFDSQANLVGPIPANWAKLKKLQYLTIYNSSISGPVPSFLSQFTALQSLEINYCKLTGTIPASLGNLASLDTIILGENQLTGPIPSTLFGKLKKGLRAYLDLSYNKLLGPIPKSFGAIGFSGVDLQNNQLSRDASFLFGSSKPAFQILLGRNKLVFDLTNVEYPVNSRFSLDISHNKIYGSISNQITETQASSWFIMSYNELCGKIPRGGNFTPNVAEQFAYNKCLCGEPLPACK